MAFDFSKETKAFDKKVYLSSPTMHREEFLYVKEAFDTNWLSTVGKNIDEIEKISIEKIIYQIRNAMLEEYNSINEPNNTDIIDKYSHEYLEGENIYG